eukprot:CAMPEP_0194753348 /NCGR_PEP_ID=MMETSP0323_2-20130528/7301_1 /TAXON_ID=2866 ORGANISM="Crypthecodinium cohnii, Strain Seligo" /NCGR_SAMPLE_ID=MMETSP0323_2 /ASSEMBLY_ACC=CAM_ASM_000346 /LENGTH=61 /DNA_ID=CAMNT_0039671145 /DNA_START=4 /DNA_END=189 /DNA_ORIENTATION=-
MALRMVAASSIMPLMRRSSVKIWQWKRTAAGAMAAGRMKAPARGAATMANRRRGAANMFKK